MIRGILAGLIVIGIGFMIGTAVGMRVQPNWYSALIVAGLAVAIVSGSVYWIRRSRRA